MSMIIFTHFCTEDVVVCMNGDRPKWDIMFEETCLKEGRAYPGIRVALEKWLDVLGEACDNPKTRPLVKEAFLKLVRISMEGEIRDWERRR